MSHVVNPNFYRIKYTLSSAIVTINKHKYNGFFETKAYMLSQFLKDIVNAYNSKSTSKIYLLVSSLKICFKNTTVFLFFLLKQTILFKKKLKFIKCSLKKIGKISKIHNIIKQNVLKSFLKNLSNYYYRRYKYFVKKVSTKVKKHKNYLRLFKKNLNKFKFRKKIKKLKKKLKMKRLKVRRFFIREKKKYLKIVQGNIAWEKRLKKNPRRIVLVVNKSRTYLRDKNKRIRQKIKRICKKRVSFQKFKNKSKKFKFIVKKKHKIYKKKALNLKYFFKKKIKSFYNIKNNTCSLKKKHKLIKKDGSNFKKKTPKKIIKFAKKNFYFFFHKKFFRLIKNIKLSLKRKKNKYKLYLKKKLKVKKKNFFNFRNSFLYLLNFKYKRKKYRKYLKRKRKFLYKIKLKIITKKNISFKANITKNKIKLKVVKFPKKKFCIKNKIKRSKYFRKKRFIKGNLKKKKKQLKSKVFKRKILFIKRLKCLFIKKLYKNTRILRKKYNKKINFRKSKKKHYNLKKLKFRGNYNKKKLKSKVLKIKNKLLVFKNKSNYILSFIVNFFFRNIVLSMKNKINFSMFKFLSNRVISKPVFIVKKFWGAMRTSDMFADAIILNLMRKKKIKDIIKSTVKYLFKLYKKRKLRGYFLLFMGRFTRKDRAMYSWKKIGRYSRSNRLSIIDFSNKRVALKYSSCSVKISILRSLKRTKYVY